jgi:hypothetical protein
MSKGAVNLKSVSGTKMDYTNEQTDLQISVKREKKPTRCSN